MLPDIPLPFDLPIVGDSLKGYGFSILVGFLSCVWLAVRRTGKAKGDPDLVLNLAFIALIAGFGGGRLFHVIHYWEKDYAHLENRVAAMLSLSGGMEFFGGFVGATVGILLYLAIKPVSLRMYGDLAAPSVMWAHAFGRVGCFLAGCCWGQFCMTDHHEPELAWAVQFPYWSGAQRRHWEEMRTTLPGELINVTAEGKAHPISTVLLNLTEEDLARPELRVTEAKEALATAEAAGEPEEDLAKLRQKLTSEEKRLDLFHELILPQLANAEKNFGVDQAGLLAMTKADSTRSLWVHPTQLYSAITLMLGSVCLSLLLRYRQRHGVVMAALFLMYGVGRFVMEVMRSDNPHDTVGLTASQAISLGLIATGAATWLIVSRLPLRSPLAVPYVEKGKKSDDIPADAGAPAAT